MSFKVGDIIRYADGETALMVVLEINDTKYSRVSGHRIYGREIFGSLKGCYSTDARLANNQELVMWHRINKTFEIFGEIGT